MGAKYRSRDVNFEELVFRGVESDELDYKHHMSWHTMSRAAKGKIVRHLMAFANTKGGFIVIGVGEDKFGNPTCRTGVSQEESGSFDPTSVGNFVNSHVEPPIDFTIERPFVRGRRYVIFAVRPFRRLPHVCCNTIEGEIQSGVFYIRTVEASSRPARRASEMQELIRRAMRNEREELGRMLRGILYETRNSVAPDERTRYSDTLEESQHYFMRRMKLPERPVICFSAEPGGVGDISLPLPELKKHFQAAWQLLPEAEFLRDGEKIFQTTPTSLRHFSQESCRMWQFFNSGLFCFFYMPELTAGAYPMEKLVQLCAESVGFISRLYAGLGWDEELLTLRIAVVNANNFMLQDGNEVYSAGSAEPEVEMCRSAADLASGREQHASRLIRRLSEVFHLPDFRIDELSRPVADILERRW